jgi:predicted porin
MSVYAAGENGIVFNVTDTTAVKLYGVLDLYVTDSHNGANSSSMVMNPGGLTQNVLGFNIAKDHGNGFKFGTTLEIGYAPDTGNGKSASQGASNVVFGKRATLDLVSSQYGGVYIGRQSSPLFSAITAYDGLSWGSSIGPFLYNGANITTASNSFVYKSPKFWDRLSFSGMYSMGEQTGSDSDYRANSQWVANLAYDSQGFHASAAYWRQNLTNQVISATSNSSAGATVPAVVNMTVLGASYDFGRFKPWVIFSRATDSSTQNQTELSYGSNTTGAIGYHADQQAYEIGLRTILNEKFNLFLNTGGMKDKAHTGVGGKMSSARLEYYYDKNLTFWGGAAQLRNDSNSYFQVYGASPTSEVSSSTAGTIYGGSGYTTNSNYAGKKITSLASGIRYTF